MSKKLYLFANWKMYLNVEESKKLARVFGKISYPKGSEVVVFPSSLAMVPLAAIFKKSKLAFGAQNTYWADKGGFTGEVSAAMFKDLGCSFALVGHAERRHLFHETNHDVRLKLEAILNLAMTPVLCVGETREERKSGDTEEVLEAQIRAAYQNLAWREGIKPIVAYEPVWAIGTGESCDPKEAERISSLISDWTEKLIATPAAVIYGGSVGAKNIREYVGQPHIEGALVGGASAQKESWSGLVKELV